MGESPIQIFGTKKCKETQKAVRFFKERGIPIQERDLKSKGISPGELQSVLQGVGEEALLDKESPLYRKKGLAYMEFDPAEEILEAPLLMKTPVVRWKGKASAGYQPEQWKTWLD